MVTSKFFLVAKKEVKFDPCRGSVLWQDTLEPKPGYHLLEPGITY